MTVSEPAAVDLLSGVSRLVRTTRTYAHLREQQLGRAGLSLGVLAALATGPVRPGELAVSLHVSPSAVSRAAAALVDQGLVTRATDEHDARACTLALTGAGAARLQLQRREQARLVQRLLEHWDEEQVRTLATLLDAFGAVLEDEVDATRRPAGAPPGPSAPPSPRTATTTSQEVPA